MDSTSILNAIIEGLGQIWWVFLLIPIYIYIQSPSFKGKLGEWFVNHQLQKKIDLTECVIMNDVLLPTKNGTTQIDHIIVAPNGIWVLETKFYKGWITGTQKSKLWKQTIFKYKKTFQNPFRQNYKHCKTIEEHTGLSEEYIYNHIVLLGDFKSKPIKELHTRVSTFIIQFKQNKNVVIEDVDSVVKTIWNIKLDNCFKNKREHVKHVKNIVKEKSNVKCKHCGNREGNVLKKGYSEYYHCPKCKKNSSK